MVMAVCYRDVVDAHPNLQFSLIGDYDPDVDGHPQLFLKVNLKVIRVFLRRYNASYDFVIR